MVIQLQNFNVQKVTKINMKRQSKIYKTVYNAKTQPFQTVFSSFHFTMK